MVDVARIIFREAGYNVDLKIRPWTRVINEVRSGKINGIVACFKSHAPDFIFPTVNLGISQAKFYVRKDNPWRYNGTESLKKMKLGTVQDYDYQELNDYIRKNPDKVEVVVGQDPVAQNIERIMLGRIGVMNDNENVVKYTLLKLKLNDKIVQAGYYGEPNIYYIAFSPKNPQSKIYAKILSDGIVRLRQKGQLKEILGRYGLNDWE
jgi:polar amino acid transport system substrate-binding protein